MARYLITKSLLSAWMYMFDCLEDNEEEAEKSFLLTLRREPHETTAAQQRGCDFENLVTALLEHRPSVNWHRFDSKGKLLGEAEIPLPEHPWLTPARQMADMLRDSQLQVKVSREIEVHGLTFLAYGILDALKAGTIYDIKFKNISFGSQKTEMAGSYLASPQHPMYFYLVPEAREFKYLASDGEDLYIERYTPEETRPVADIIAEFIDSITGMGLLDLYKEHWSAK